VSILEKRQGGLYCDKRRGLTSMFFTVELNKFYLREYLNFPPPIFLKLWRLYDSGMERYLVLNLRSIFIITSLKIASK